MQINCTKKLLDELGVKPADSHHEKTMLFSWHANIIMVNRRKTIVLANDHNRYIIVIYGLRAKDFKNFSSIALKAISEVFEAEFIAPEVIDAYIQQAGPISFHKTGDRAHIAKLNKACERVQWFQDLLDPETVTQKELSLRASDQVIVNGEKEYFTSYESLFEDLKGFSNGPIFKYQAGRFKVKLDMEELQVWRQIVVPLEINFYQLHHVLQKVFNWQNSHLFDFLVMDERGKPLSKLVCVEESFDFPSEVQMEMADEVKLSEYFPEFNKAIYRYDFGDGWEHIIELEEIIEVHENNQPICTAGEGDAPPEDVGGVQGYLDFLDVIKDPSNKNYQNAKNWGILQGYKSFDIHSVNRWLIGVLKHWN